VAVCSASEEAEGDGASVAAGDRGPRGVPVRTTMTPKPQSRMAAAFGGGGGRVANEAEAHRSNGAAFAGIACESEGRAQSAAQLAMKKAAHPEDRQPRC
jgi:hypothetical protein